MYLGHRRFLPVNHPLRKKGKHFKGKADHQTKPGNRTGEDVLNMVKDVKVVFGLNDVKTNFQSKTKVLMI